MDTNQLAEFGHAVYQDAEGRWTCDHRGHDGVPEDRESRMLRRCFDMAVDAYEDEMLRDGTHPTLGGYDGSGR